SVEPDSDTGRAIVRALSVGTSKVTSTAADGTGKKAVCTIKVGEAAGEVKVSSKSGTELEEGKTLKLQAAFAASKPAVKTITWSTSDPTIAVVDAKGVVTGVSEGEAVITAQPDPLAGGEADSISVSVKAKEAVSKIDNLSVKIGKDPMVPIQTKDAKTPEVAMFTGKSFNLSAYATVDGKTKKLNSKEVVFATGDPSKLSMTAAGKGKALLGDRFSCAEVYVTCTPVGHPELAQTFYFTVFDRMKKITLNASKVTIGKNGRGVLTVAQTMPAYPSVPMIHWEASSTDVRLAKVGASQSVDSLSASDFKEKLEEGIDFSKGERLAYLAVNPTKKCVITASTYDGNKTAKCAVTVTGEVTGLEFKTTKAITGGNGSYNVSLKPGGSVSVKPVITAEYGADKTIVWKSDDASAVTVKNGKVTVRKSAAGGKTAHITAMTSDGKQSAVLTVEIQ
ncbi:MAG: Ig-like domain-containing protein, partial [Lachnospiraceae bacterium]|nr:Ig-like domain-containing protein [Lachnospiraceae bacterium]